ncbi:hypothetical protein QEG98_40445 [Myxococcus sp. MxC21-1]|uniref:hypothetical protein n=1 Tax=Myxococcus sp. MxC21-1 TaxID=3041439 RepID=UPI00292D8090|nr:hypothetical protein [Myxococcus sp. MxC21-1]WNZ62026.1 hypothetical protein QEG98_40445 [Myxococcus sp. MxC21-1]
MLEPGTGTALASELGDLDLMLREASTCEGLPAPAEALQAWLHAMKDTPYSAAPDAERRAQYDGALARWKKTAHMPWLVAALAKATPDAPGVPELLAASAKVAPTSPAGLTVAYHAARLLHGRGEIEAARARLATVPAELTRDLPSTDNLLREERLAVARDPDEAMREAVNIIADYEMSSSYSEPYTTPLAERPRLFSPRAVAMLEPRLTAKRMGELAAGDILPPALRRQLMWTAFARATVAGDDATIQAVAKRRRRRSPRRRRSCWRSPASPRPRSVSSRPNCSSWDCPPSPLGSTRARTGWRTPIPTSASPWTCPTSATGGAVRSRTRACPRALRGHARRTGRGAGVEGPPGRGQLGALLRPRRHGLGPDPPG